MLIMRRQAGGIKDPELIEPTYQPRHAGSGDLDAIALLKRPESQTPFPVPRDEPSVVVLSEPYWARPQGATWRDLIDRPVKYPSRSPYHTLSPACAAASSEAQEGSIGRRP